MANTVEWYKDGLGNLLSGVQWDGDPVTAETIRAWSNNRCTLDRRGALGFMAPGTTLRHHVGLNDWVCIGADLRIFAMTNQQMASSYTETTAPQQAARNMPA